ncbi:MAG: NAD(+)/NADH kinase [Acidimicrobiia bacterium]
MVNSIYLCLNSNKEQAHLVADEISNTAQMHNVQVVEKVEDSDCVVTIGGDGTFLYGTRLALRNNKAIAGINLGRFGFLPSFPSNNVEVLFESLKNSQPQTRCVLDIDFSNGRYNAINEVVIERKRVQRAARITMISSPPVFGELQREINIQDSNERSKFILNEMEDVIEGYSEYIDDKGRASQGPTFVCDGVIVSTPLGSTAYSSSAGGPAISPYSNVMSLTMVALHHPRIPPVVLTNNENLYLVAEEECVLVADGQHIGDLGPGEPIRICVGSKGIPVYERPASVLSKLAHAFGADRLSSL